jgi:hypothetical protein
VLTEQSVENILLSISASGQWATSTGTSSGTPLAGKEITIGTSNSNVNVDNLSASNRAACTALQSRGWEVVINGSIVSEYALYLNGTDEWAECGTGLGDGLGDNYAGNLTVSMWFKADVTSHADGMFALTTFANAHGPFQVVMESNNLAFQLNANGWRREVAFTDKDSWHHLACVYATGSEANSKLYLDGVVQAGTTAGSFPLASAMDFAGLKTIIGAYYNASYEFVGTLDEVSVWDEALDADAVTAVYNAGSPINLNRDKGNYDNASDIVSWWRMGDNDSGAGNFVTDVIATDGEALHLPAVNLNYASVPDAADLDGFGNFTFELTDVTVPDWTPTGTNTLISKYASASKSWVLQLLTTGKLGLYLSFDGSAETGYLSSVVTGITDGATASIRVIRSGTSLTFELDTGSGYSQLGTTVTVSASAIHAGTRDVMIGTHETASVSMFGGSIGRARIWSDATQSTNVLDVNFTLANKGATSFDATSGQVVTVHSTAIDNPAAIRSATDGVLVNAPTFVVDNPPNYSNYSLSFDGGDDFVELGSQAGDLRLSGSDGTISAWIKIDDVSAGDSAKRIVDKSDGGGAANGYALLVELDGSVGGFIDGVASLYSAAGTVTDATWHHVVWTWDGTYSKIYIDGGLSATAGSTARPPSDTTGMRIGSWSHSTAREFDGLMDEVAIWNSALTSAQINDIYNGGVPAALTSLSPLGWWRLGENDSGAGVTITDQGSGTNNGTLTNGPTFSRSVPAEDATWNNRSIEFDGVNEYADCGTGTGDALGDNYAGSLTVSMWLKADTTGADDGLFEIGTFVGPAGLLNILIQSGSKIWFRLNEFGWKREVAFSDTASWHHLVCVYATGNEANSKMYLDGVAVGATTGTFPSAADMDFAGLKTTIGGYYSSAYTFNGKIDEVGIFHSELSTSQVLQIYNGGKPASLKEFSPDSWYRMGDDDDTGGTTIRDLGVVSGAELITGFTNGTTYPLDTLVTSGRDITSAIETSGNWGGCASNSFALTEGEVYEVSFNLTYNSGTTSVRAVIVNDADGSSAHRSTAFYTTTNGSNTGYLVATITDAAAHLQFGTHASSHVINFAATNISLKLVNGNPATLVNTPTFSTDTP